MKPLITTLLGLAAAGLAQAAVLHDNGAAVNAQGRSIGTRNTPNTFYGFGMQDRPVLPNAVADDFSVAAGGWTLQSIDFFAIQNLATTFTLQSVSWSIVAGDVNNGTLVAQGTTTLSNGGLVGYRVAPNALTSTQRPIYRAGADIADVSLAAGHYWLRWSMSGSLSSGPWQPPVSDASVIGNAMQSADHGAFSGARLPDGSAAPMELPFVLYGTVNAVPEPANWALSLAGLGLLGLAARRRRPA